MRQNGQSGVRRRSFARGLSVLAICLILGALVNVIVAALCVDKVKFDEFSRQFQPTFTSATAPLASPLELEQLRKAGLNPLNDGRFVEKITVRKFGVSADGYYMAKILGSPSNPIHARWWVPGVLRIRSGWPFFAFDETVATSYFDDDRAFNPTIRVAPSHHDHDSIPHPIRVRAIGFTANAALYSLMMLVVWIATCGLWNWLSGNTRKRRGLCPKCGYRLFEGLIKGCPECGWGRAQVSA